MWSYIIGGVIFAYASAVIFVKIKRRKSRGGCGGNCSECGGRC